MSKDELNHNMASEIHILHQNSYHGVWQNKNENEWPAGGA